MCIVGVSMYLGFWYAIVDVCVGVCFLLAHCGCMCLQEEIPLKDDSVNVLLSLDAQKGQHFSQKFSTEDSQTFWYQDEKGIVSQQHSTHIPTDIVASLISLLSSMNHAIYLLFVKCSKEVAYFNSSFPTLYTLDLTSHKQTLTLPQELYPQHHESSADDSSGDEEYPGGEFDDPWHLGETAPDDEFAHLSDLWEDTTPHAEGKGRKYTFSKQR